MRCYRWNCPKQFKIICKNKITPLTKTGIFARYIINHKNANLFLTYLVHTLVYLILQFGPDVARRGSPIFVFSCIYKSARFAEILLEVSSLHSSRLLLLPAEDDSEGGELLFRWRSSR